MIFVNMKCKICKNTCSNEVYTVKRPFSGTIEDFQYIKCSYCGCLQIATIPSNLSEYYAGYGSFQKISEKESSIMSWLRKQCFKYYTKNFNLIGWLLSKTVCSYPWLDRGYMNFKSKILDVGCGSGSLIVKMANGGFENVRGIDPFLEQNLKYSCARGKVCVSVEKKEIFDITDRFDIIFLHHSLEHMIDADVVLKKLNSLISPDGFIVIRIPVIDSYDWEEYNVNCFQLADDPRHLFLHTKKSFELLVKRNNFYIKNVKYEASVDNLKVNEILKRGLSSKNAKFTKKEIELFRKKAKTLIRDKKAGIITFYLSKNHDN